MTDPTVNFWKEESSMLMSATCGPKTANCALTSFLRDRLQTSSDDVVVPLQLVAQSVPPPQLADEFGRLQSSSILDLLDDGTQLFWG